MDLTVIPSTHYIATTGPNERKGSPSFAYNAVPPCLHSHVKTQTTCPAKIPYQEKNSQNNSGNKRSDDEKIESDRQITRMTDTDKKRERDGGGRSGKTSMKMQC